MGIRRAAGPSGAAPSRGCHSTQPCRASAASWGSLHPPPSFRKRNQAPAQATSSIAQGGAGCSEPPTFPSPPRDTGQGRDFGVPAGPHSVTQGRGGRAAAMAPGSSVLLSLCPSLEPSKMLIFKRTLSFPASTAASPLLCSPKMAQRGWESITRGCRAVCSQAQGCTTFHRAAQPCRAVHSQTQVHNQCTTGHSST